MLNRRIMTNFPDIVSKIDRYYCGMLCPSHSLNVFLLFTNLSNVLHKPYGYQAYSLS